MRYRILASFQGAPYEAGVGPDESDVVLFAACPPPEELRFEPATGHWRKRVSRGQVQTLYESRPVGTFRGERCIVLDDLSDRLHIVYLGHDALRAAQLGYWEVDRGVFELITPRHEVSDIVEQRVPLPIRSDSGHHTRPGPMPSERSDDYDTSGGNSSPSSRDDSQPFRFGLPSSSSLDLPLASLSRSESSLPRSADQSDVAIPPVPEPPLPLEAEALRAASSSARRGQKSGQSRRPQPTVEPQARAAAGPASDTAAPIQPAPVQAAPVQAAPMQVAPVHAAPVQAAPVQAAPVQAAPVQAAPVRAQVLEPATEVSQPLPAPVPAAAMLSKAAMLSHAAAMAARLASASDRRPDPPTLPTAPRGGFSTLSEQESHPDAEAGLTPPTATAQPREEEPEPLGIPDRVSLEPEPASLAPEPYPPSLAPEPAPGSPAPEPVQGSPAPEPSPGLLAPEQVSVPVTAEAAAPPIVQAADAAAYIDQPALEEVPAGELAESQVHGSVWPGQEALPEAPADESSAISAPVPPEADSPPVPVAPPAAGAESLTSPEPAEPTPAQSAAAAAALAPDAAPTDTTPAQPTPPPAQPAPDHADGTAATQLVGMSDPPSVAVPPAVSAVPSWMPQGPVQPQPGFDFAQLTPQTPDVDYYAPYVASEPVPRNGIATANGAAAVVDLGLVAPMPIQPPDLQPPSTLPAQPEPADELSEPAAEAQAEPGATTRRRRGTKRRLPTQKIFSDLATQAAIPAAAYAIGEEVDGAMCLVRTDEGFEVFNAAAGARHEVRVFQDEESAYFYLFGVLVAESVRTGALVPRD